MNKETINKVSMVTGMQQEEIELVLKPVVKINELATRSMKELIDIIDDEKGINETMKINLLVTYFDNITDGMDKNIRDIIINIIKDKDVNEKELRRLKDKVDKL